LPDTAEFVATTEPGAGAAQEVPDEIFVRAIDLPTLSVRQARAAVAQQLDILSPLPPAEVSTSVVLVGPVEGGLNRFAVAFAPRGLLARMSTTSERTVTLIGKLDGEVIAFRFDRLGAAPRVADWGPRLETATIAGACLAILLAAASLRLDREIDQAQARLDAANTQVQRLTLEAASLARIGGAWRAAQATQKAGLVDCALSGLAKATGGPVTLSRLTLANGQVSARLSAPASDAALAALRALGFTPASTASPSASAPATPAAVQDVQTSAAACR
jgi:hypothetical protein